MPIEIKELHIKINVKEGVNNQHSGTVNSNDDAYHTTVENTIEEVMELIANKKER